MVETGAEVAQSEVLTQNTMATEVPTVPIEQPTITTAGDVGTVGPETTMTNTTGYYDTDTPTTSGMGMTEKPAPSMNKNIAPVLSVEPTAPFESPQTPVSQEGVTVQADAPMAAGESDQQYTTPQESGEKPALTVEDFLKAQAAMDRSGLSNGVNTKILEENARFAGLSEAEKNSPEAQGDHQKKITELQKELSLATAYEEAWREMQTEINRAAESTGDGSNSAKAKALEAVLHDKISQLPIEVQVLARAREMHAQGSEAYQNADVRLVAHTPKEMIAVLDEINEVKVMQAKLGTEQVIENGSAETETAEASAEEPTLTSEGSEASEDTAADGNDQTEGEETQDEEPESVNKEKLDQLLDMVNKLLQEVLKNPDALEAAEGVDKQALEAMQQAITEAAPKKGKLIQGKYIFGMLAVVLMAIYQMGYKTANAASSGR